MLDYRNYSDRVRIRSIVKDIVSENPDADNKHLYALIREFCNIDKDNIYILVKNAKDDTDCSVEQDNSTIIDDNGNHEILFNGEKVSFDINFVDLLFLYYSKHGYDLSGEAMQQEFGLTAWDWIDFKRQFKLYKDSHVVSDWSIENLPKEKLDVQLFRANNAHADRVRDKMIITHTLLEKKELARLRKVESNTSFTFNRLQWYIDAYVPQTHVKSSINTPVSSDCEVYCISDFHLGKNGTAEVVARLRDVAQDIVMSSKNNIELLILGDIVESLVPGGMHPWQEAAQEIRWFDLWKLAVDELSHLIGTIESSGKNITTHMMAGNHGRVGTKNAGKSDWLWELSIYETVRRCVKSSVIIHNEYVDKLDIDGVQYVFSHGENGFDKESPESICWKFGLQPWTPVVIVYWHLHNAKISEAMWVTKVGLPALAGKGEFDTMIRAFSEPWYVKFWNSYGKVNLQLTRL